MSVINAPPNSILTFLRNPSPTKGLNQPHCIWIIGVEKRQIAIMQTCINISLCMFGLSSRVMLYAWVCNVLD